METAFDRFTIPPVTQPSGSVLATCRAILELLLPYRRAADETHGDHPDFFPEQLRQLTPFISLDEPIVLTLPGFPCKSPNPGKVLGRLPDLGERLSLSFLDQLCRRIDDVYTPGARILICSDGHAFADFIGVPDPDIDAYGDELRAIIQRENLTRIDTFDLRHVYGDRHAEEKRRLLDNRYAPTLEVLQAETRSDEQTLRLYRGITRFLLEDTAGFDGSRSALQRQCRQRAYGVIQRSRAWGNLIADRYPNSLRLSIHPQPRGAAKFGIKLLSIDNMWTTPWHSVVLKHPSGLCELVPHDRARTAGRLVERDGRPDHYEIVEPTTA
jgi:pyoverdine/dityrosine biosynthesis protein Dit1